MMPMTRAMLAAVLLIYVVGAYLFRHYKRARVVSGIPAEFNGLPPDRDYGRVRERNPAVRMSTVHDRKTEEQYEQIDESRSRVVEVEDTRVETSARRPGLAQDIAGSTPAPATNLVPFERGYAFNFSRRIR